MNKAQLSERLKYFRKVKGLSQEELSLRTNVTVRTIQRIEKSEVNPHLKTVKLLAVALDVEITELIPLVPPKEETIKLKWLLLLHATPLLGLVIPLSNVLIPLFLWIHKREDHPIYNQHGIRVINFQITISLLGIIVFLGLLTIDSWGFWLFIAFIPIITGIIILNIIGLFRNSKCYYPLAFPFLKIKPSKHLVMGLCILNAFYSISCASKPSMAIERLDGSLISKTELSKQIEQWAQEAEVAGMSVTIFNANRPVYKKIIGYRDLPNKLELNDSTNMYGASLSKAVFSLLVMRLVEEKVIDLDTPLESYLPKKIHEYAPETRWHDNYSDLKNDSLYARITARMCLTHSTGFPNWRFIESDQKLRVNFTPGTKYSYSGEGFVYLQVVLEKLTGQSLETLAQNYVFKPLQMHRSSYQWQSQFEKNYAYGHQPNGIPYKKDMDNEPRSGSTLETTINDYTLFLTAILEQKLLSKSSYSALFSPQIRIRSKQQFGPNAHVETHDYDALNFSYGLGWSYLETPYGIGVAKGGHGDGFQHYAILFPEAEKGLLIMTNSDRGESLYKLLLEAGLGDIYTPWHWYNFIPYKAPKN